MLRETPIVAIQRLGPQSGVLGRMGSDWWTRFKGKAEECGEGRESVVGRAVHEGRIDELVHGPMPEYRFEAISNRSRSMQGNPILKIKYSMLSII